MQKLLTELKSLLNEDLALHEGLKSDLTFESEQDGQLGGSEYFRLQQRKYHWVHRIEEIESRRIAQVEHLAQHWNEAPKGLSLREIIARSPAPLAGELEACHEGLTGLVAEIRRLGKETGQNAQARLKAIDATLAVIGEAVKMHPTYSGAGRLRQRPPTFKQTSA